MLFYLVVVKFEYLQAIRVGSLSSARFCKVVYNFAIRVSLLDILVVEVHNCIAIREDFSLDAIAKNDLLLAVLIGPLNLAIIRNLIVYHSCVLW